MFFLNSNLDFGIDSVCGDTVTFTNNGNGSYTYLGTGTATDSFPFQAVANLMPMVDGWYTGTYYQYIYFNGATAGTNTVGTGVGGPDFNGDGFPDACYVGSNNFGNDPNNGPANTPDYIAVAYGNGFKSWGSQNISQIPNVSAISCIDVNGDGHPDIIAIFQSDLGAAGVNPPSPTTFSLLLNDGNDNFQASPSATFQLPSQWGLFAVQASNLANGGPSFMVGKVATGGTVAVATTVESDLFLGGQAIAYWTTSVPTSLGLSSNANPSIYSQQVQLTASVSAGGQPVTCGSVSFYLDGASIGSASVNGSGSAILAASVGCAGSHTVSANFAGCQSYLASSNSFVQAVNKALVAVTVGNTPSSLQVNSPATLNSTVTPTGGASGTPTGAVTFTVNGSSVGSSNLNGSGSASVGWTPTTIGNYSISASYAGDGNFSPGSSPVAQDTVSTPTNSSISSTANPSSFGQSVTLTVTVTSAAGTPTGTVALSDGSTSLGGGTLTNGTFSLTTSSLSAGSHSLSATFTGTAGYMNSTGSLTQNVNKANSSVVVSSGTNPSIYGGSVTFTATVTGGATGETITFYDGSTSIGTGTLNSGGIATLTISTLSGGSHTITAAYPGDSNWSSSTSAGLPQTVNRAASSVSLASSLNPSTYGNAITFTATVTGGANGETITFYDAGTSIGTGTLSSGTAALTISTLIAGSHTITASYLGDSNWNSSTSAALPQNVNKVAARLSVTSSENPAVYADTVTFTLLISGAGVLPTGTVTLMDGTAVLAMLPFDGSGKATYNASVLSGGIHHLKAAYNGDSNYY